MSSFTELRVLPAPTFDPQYDGPGGEASSAATPGLLVFDLEQLDPYQVFDSGVRSLKLDVPTAETGRPADSLRMIRVLRDFTAAGIRLAWKATEWSEIEMTQFYHLSPPTFDDRPGADGYRRWVSAFTYGLCYYRIGPTFVTVVDRRHPDKGGRYILRGSAAELFLALAVPTPVAELAAGQDRLMRRFSETGLVITAAGEAVALPYRMRRWPYPCYGI